MIYVSEIPVFSMTRLSLPWHKSDWFSSYFPWIIETWYSDRSDNWYADYHCWIYYILSLSVLKDICGMFPHNILIFCSLEWLFDFIFSDKKTNDNDKVIFLQGKCMTISTRKVIINHFHLVTLKLLSHPGFNSS